MNKNTKTVLALLLIGIALSCKQADYNASGDAVAEKEAAADSTAVVSSSAAVEQKNSNRKFIRTADIRFKVKNVARSTTGIEDAVTKFGGFVTYTNLQSTIINQDRTKISPDSTLVSTQFSVENNMTIRVPNTQLDTVIKTIAKQIGFLNHRIIKADDVTLQLLSNKMAQKRSITSEKRLAGGIDSKGKKLDQIVDAENVLDAKKEQSDARVLDNLSLKDQVNFSTLTLQIYQDETTRHELTANEKSINAYRPNIGLQVWDSFKSGWFLLEEMISFVVVLWPLALLSFFGFWGYKKWLRKKS